MNDLTSVSHAGRESLEFTQKAELNAAEELRAFVEHASEQLDWKSLEEIGHYVDSIKNASDSILEEMGQENSGELSQSEMDDIIMQAGFNARKRKA